MDAAASMVIFHEEILYVLLRMLLYQKQERIIAERFHVN
jgi:hypothetical protein